MCYHKVIISLLICNNDWLKYVLSSKIYCDGPLIIKKTFYLTFRNEITQDIFSSSIRWSSTTTVVVPAVANYFFCSLRATPVPAGNELFVTRGLYTYIFLVSFNDVRLAMLSFHIC